MPLAANSLENPPNSTHPISHTENNISVSPKTNSVLFFRVLAILTFLLLMATAFRAGWQRPETDFPNYYTAAVALRHGEPLRDLYDWTWFERQMNYAGIENRVGAYSPQTPLTMLPFVPFAKFPMQTAKRIWLVLNLFFLFATIWMLSRVTKFSFAQIWLFAFCGYFALQNNFRYGQYYVFLLFLLTLCFFLLHRKNHALSGCVAGITFGLKLYGGPLLLFFLARRHWKALAGMVVAAALLAALAIILFGPGDIYYYATQIFPRSLEGNPADPYNPGSPNLVTFLHRTFLSEPELNPHPLFEAPWLFFFLRTFTTLAILLFVFLGANSRQSSERHDFAWFMVAAVFLSSSTASYTFILLLLPLVLLLDELPDESKPREAAFLFVSYFLLTLPLPMTWLFPKVWLLLILFLVLGRSSWRQIPRRSLIAATAVALLIAFIGAQRNIKNYANEPGRHFEPIAVQSGAIFSDLPVISRAGLFYQSMRMDPLDRYVLRWVHNGQSEELSFAGQALQPRLSPDGNSIDFELVANRTSTWMRFDPATRTSTPLSTPVPANSKAPAISPDGKWEAITSTKSGPQQIFVHDLSNGVERQLTGGNCNNSSPAWTLDSKSIIFASDCDRAVGLPALYRVPIPASVASSVTSITPAR
jgi:hypothetical protein